MSHVILGSSGVNSLASLPRLMYRTALRYSSCATSAEQRQLQASHSSTFPRTSGKHHSDRAAAPPGTALWHSWHQALQHCRQTSHTAPAPRMLFSPSHPVHCRMKGIGRGKLSRVLQLLPVFSFLHITYITFRSQAWKCCSCTLVVEDKLLFAFLKIESAHKRSMQGVTTALFCILPVK